MTEIEEAAIKVCEMWEENEIRVGEPSGEKDNKFKIDYQKTKILDERFRNLLEAITAKQVIKILE